MLNFLKKILIISICFFSTYVYSLNPSSYLIANTAVNFYDFKIANNHFLSLDAELIEKALFNKLLTSVNLKLILEANNVAEKILEINKSNQEAWIVRLTYAKIKNDLEIFNEYNKIEDKSEMELLNFVFYSDNNKLKKNKIIAKSVLKLVYASIDEKIEQANYKFLLFYLSIANILDPELSEAYFYTAKIHQILKNYSQSDFFYNKINSDHVLFVESQKNIAINKYHNGLFAESKKLLKELISKHGDSGNLSMILADLYRYDKKYEIAIELYTNLINLNNKLSDNYSKIFYLRGICYERLGKWNLAEKDFLHSLDIYPNSPEVLNYLAYGWLEKNINFDMAFKMLNKAYTANPTSYHILDSLAWAYFKKNQLEEAVELMEEVIIMAPGESISLDHLADIYYALNRKREAWFFWKQALDLVEPEDILTDKLKKKINNYNAG